MTIEQLHQFRKQIDACIKVAENDLLSYVNGVRVNSNPENIYGREMSLVRTKLQEAKMWAGKCLERADAPFPAELRDEATMGSN